MNVFCQSFFFPKGSEKNYYATLRARISRECGTLTSLKSQTRVTDNFIILFCAITEKSHFNGSGTRIK